MKIPTSLFTCRINLSKRRGNYRRVRQGASPQIHQKGIKIWNNCYKTTSHFSSVTQSCLILHDPTDHSTPGLPVHQQVQESNHLHLESVMPSNHLILGHPLLLLASILPRIRVFSNESALHIRWLKYWSFSFSISPSNEHSGLISFRMDWLELLAVQGTLKSLLQHPSSKAAILQRSAQ